MVSDKLVTQVEINDCGNTFEQVYSYDVEQDSCITTRLR